MERKQAWLNKPRNFWTTVAVVGAGLWLFWPKASTPVKAEAYTQVPPLVNEVKTNTPASTVVTPEPVNDNMNAADHNSTIVNGTRNNVTVTNNYNSYHYHATTQAEPKLQPQAQAVVLPLVMHSPVAKPKPMPKPECEGVQAHEQRVAQWRKLFN